jgi:RNA polymerase sigma-70 factor (sigma-E family)
MAGHPPEDFGDFVGGALPSLMRLGRMLAGSPEAAEDLVQSAFASTLAVWSRVRTEDPFGYVRRVMINENISVWRRWSSRVRYEDPPEVVGADEPAVAAIRLTVRDALTRLPVRQRTVLVLRYYCQLSEQEIAREMGCRPGTVKSQAARGMATLRAELAAVGGPDLVPTAPERRIR